MKYALVILISLMLLFYPAAANADESVENEVKNQLGEYDFGEWQDVIDSFTENGADIESLIEGFTLGKTDAISGDDFIESLWKALKQGLGKYAWFIAVVVATAAASGICIALFPDKEGSGLSEVAGFAITIPAVSVAVLLLADASRTTVDTVSAIAKATQASTPVLSLLLSATGSVASAAVFKPLTLFMNGTLIKILENVVMPIALGAGVIGVVTSMSERVQLKQMFSLFKTSGKWIMGIVSTVYLGVSALQGVIASGYDGVSVKTAKYAIDKMLPVGGSLLSGTVDTVMLCSSLIKNAAGIAGIVAIALMLVTPCVSIFSAMLMLRLSGALCEPIANKCIPQLFSATADVLGFFLGIVLITAAMCVITLGIFVAIGNPNG